MTGTAPIRFLENRAGSGEDIAWIYYPAAGILSPWEA
jgi:hypothetical protein